jgi:hypothetical protein
LVAPTNTTLTLNVNAATGGLNDASNQFKVINVVTSGPLATTVSSGSITDTALTTLNISGSASYTNTGLASNLSLTSVTSSTAGTTTLTLGSGEAFTGTGSGKDAITLSSVTSAAISGTSTSTNTFYLASGFTGTQSMASITGFPTISDGATGSATLTNIVAGTALTIPVSVTGFTYQTSDTAGVTDSVAVTLSPAASTTTVHTALTDTTLIFKDNAGTGTGNLSLTSNYNTQNLTTTITNLDTGITVGGVSSLTLAGNAAFAIGGTTAWADAASTLSITNNSTSVQASSFGVTDNALTQLTVAGTTTSATTVTLADTVASSFTLVDSGSAALTFTPTFVNNATSLTITDSANAALTLTGFTDSALTTLTVTNTGGQLATLGASGAKVIIAGATTINLSAGVTGYISDAGLAVTVNAGNDNSILNLALGAAATTAGTSTVTVGNAANVITFTGGATNVAINNVTLGSNHTGLVNALTFGLTGANFATVAGGTVTNAISTDTITFGADTGQAIAAIVHGSDNATASTAITAAITASVTAPHDVGWTYCVTNNTTYIAESIGAAGVSSTTVIAVVGVHTPTVFGVAGGITIG